MSVRPATEADIPLIQELGARFHEAAGERGTYSPETLADFCRALMEEGGLFVSERGMIGGIVWPSPWSADNVIAMESFWWAEDGNGRALVDAFESWAEAKGATDIRMGYLHALEPERVEGILRRRGYKPLETIMVK